MLNHPSGRRLARVILFVAAATSGAAVTDAQDRAPRQAAEASPKLRAEVRELQATLPLRFEANQGQTDPRARFVARGHGYDLFLTARGAILSPEHGGAP